jgi:2-polyprenyl-3-methyl-5-hydroxy-6-metoxy-1,4-benzoquinol methylase
MTALKNDRALRFYSDVLGLERLHYGLWQSDETLSFDNLRSAQLRYEQLLIDQIPENASTILDVGCGTGAMSRSLKQLGYEVEGLSPDINQKHSYEEKVGTRFHQARFEEFTPEHTYDVVMMSESCQYIPLDQVFNRVQAALKDEGYWIICDYFVHTGATGKLASSGHNLEAFLAAANTAGFERITQQDITTNVTPTLDLGKDFVERCLLASELGLEKAHSKYPLIMKLLTKLFSKKVSKAKRDLDLLDAEAFAKAKSYQLLVFKNKS